MGKLLILLITFFFFLIACQPAKAEGFLTTYDSTYTVSENGSTRVNYTIKLTNTTSTNFASNFTLYTGFEHIKNLRAQDPNGAIAPLIRDTNVGKEIELEFNKRVVGLNNTLEFFVSFDTTDVATKREDVWEINIPGMSKKTDYTNFTTTVTLPVSFGTPSFSKPHHEPKLTPGFTNSFTYTKDQLKNSGISLAFGNVQTYSFKLRYHLQNKNIFPVQSVAALPPNTSYQEVAIDVINPKPVDVVLDPDGNWLAQYTLNPGEEKDVEVFGSATLTLYPKKQTLSKNERNRYLDEKEYWNVYSPKIQELAKKLKTPKAIYDYVVDSLTYDYSRVTKRQPRLGGLSALQNPKSAVCLEFTDLFISIARAAGIPAREVNGFAYTENVAQRPLIDNVDVLHVWPQFYDDKLQTWIMVDPTWGNTTGGIDFFDIFDLDHVAFVIKGQSSTYPISPGGNKDVQVLFAQNPAKLISSQVLTEVPPQSFSLLPLKVKIIVKNTGNSLLESKKVEVSSQVQGKKQILTFHNIPPFGQALKTVEFSGYDFLTKTPDTITISSNKFEKKYPVEISPFTSLGLALGGGIIVLLSVAISTIAWRARRL